MARDSNAARKFRPKAEPQKIQQLLKGAFRQYGLDKELVRYNFVIHWSEIVGDEIARRSTPECIERGTLVVRVCDSAWAQELSFQKGVILHRLKRFLDAGQHVSDVRFYVAGERAKR